VNDRKAPPDGFYVSANEGWNWHIYTARCELDEQFDGTEPDGVGGQAAAERNKELATAACWAFHARVVAPYLALLRRSATLIEEAADEQAYDGNDGHSAESRAVLRAIRSLEGGDS
jgi:hypothetical protein